MYVCVLFHKEDNELFTLNNQIRACSCSWILCIIFMLPRLLVTIWVNVCSLVWLFSLIVHYPPGAQKRIMNYYTKQSNKSFCKTDQSCLVSFTFYFLFFVVPLAVYIRVDQGQSYTPTHTLWHSLSIIFVFGFIIMI